jgi:hypothetical protein
MTSVDTGRFTVGVFQDVAWAAKGIQALQEKGLPAESLSIIAKESPDVGALIERTLGSGAERLDVTNTGVVLARGPLVAALQGPDHGFARLGIAALPPP